VEQGLKALHLHHGQQVWGHGLIAAALA